MKKIFFVASALLFVMSSYAQSGTNSPYSQYGLGVLSDQGSGFNRAMNGVALGFHDGNQVNHLNPSSYAAIDSLTFVFDVGASLQLTNFCENGVKKNARNADFDYAIGSFRAFKNVGVGFGIIPFSNIGYSYGTSEYVDDAKTNSMTTAYKGSGGVRELFVGVGVSPLKGLRIGANIGYVWGDYNRTVLNSYSDAYVNTLARYYTAEITSYKLDLGIQYTLKLNRKNDVTLGLTYTPGHSMSGTPTLQAISTNSQTSVSDTTTYDKLKNGLFIPTQYGVGLAWYHGRKWHVGADYTVQKWTEKPFPTFYKGDYVLRDDVLMDRQRFTIGGEFMANPMSRNYVNRIRFRAGLSYATPYLKVNGQDGPKEMSATVGFGLPITNAWNNRSVLNISAQYCRNAATGLITENIFRINVGLTFNERWFMKWKVE